MGRSIERITIIGGGTAGWLAAAMIYGVRNRRNDGPNLEIELIESPGTPIVGVGEATTLSMAEALEYFTVDETDFFQHCDATLKIGVKFVNWDRPTDGHISAYYHPFESPGYLYGYVPAYHYVRRKREGRISADFAPTMSRLCALMDADKAPRRADAPDYQGLCRYSYHLNAGLFGAYLKTFCTTLGVVHISDDVVEVERDARGFVAALHLKERGRHPVEFVIDCSGFRGLIVQQALSEPFIEYGDQLLCDRAIAAQLPYGDDTRLPPYTRSTGLDAGWSWNVPLYSRRGAGYVFSSAFLSDDEAKAELERHLGVADDSLEGRAIGMRIGRARRAWVGNCVAIGLAGGFVEPLESTSIHFTQMTVRWLLDNFPDRDSSAPLRDQFNTLVADLYDEIRDFIVMHYYVSNRDDTPFWNAARDGITPPDRLVARLGLWRHKLPSATDLPSQLQLFSEWNYLYVLFGKGYFDGAEFPIEPALSDEDFDRFLDRIGQQTREALQTMPDQREMLSQLRARPVQPWYRPEGEPVPASGEAAIV